MQLTDAARSLPYIKTPAVQVTIQGRIHENLLKKEE